MSCVRRVYLNFRTAVTIDGQLVHDTNVIRRHYLTVGVAGLALPTRRSHVCTNPIANTRAGVVLCGLLYKVRAGLSMLT